MLTQTETQATPASSAAALLNLPGVSFSDVISPILNQAPPGPEPPGPPPPVLPAGGEEAAVAPNATPQKLDSLHQTTQGQTTGGQTTKGSNPTQPTVLLIQPLEPALFNLSVPSAPALNTPKLTRRGEAEGTAQGIGAVEAAKSQTPAATAQKPVAIEPEAESKPFELPTDPSARLVSVQTQTLPVQQQTTPAEPPQNAAVQVVSSASAAAAPVIAVKAELAAKDTADPVPGPPAPTAISVGTGSSGSSMAGGSSGQPGQGGQNLAPNPQLMVQAPALKSASSAPAELTALSGASRAAVVQQVADKLQLLIASRSQEATVIQLSPKALGSITLTVKNLNGAIDTQIAASNDHVRTALEHSRPDLAGAIQAKGYQVGSISVSGGSTKSSGQFPSGGQAQQQPKTPQSVTQTTEPGVAASEGASAPLSFTTAQAVDVWI